MHAKFRVAEFQSKGDIRHPSLNYVCLFLLGHLPVQVTWWFLTSDGSEIQASAEFRCPQRQETTKSYGPVNVRVKINRRN